MKSASLKIAYSGAILSDETAVFIVTQRRIKCFEISEKPTSLRLQRIWSASITHGSRILLSADEKILIITDTSGAHFGLSVSNGEILWGTEPVGEGDPGVLLDDGTFVFATWRGVIQHVDPKSGQSLGPTRNLGHQVRDLHVDVKGSVSLVEIIQPVNSYLPVTHRLLRVDWPSLKCTLLDSEIDGGTVALSPDGALIALRRPGNVFQIRSVGETQAELERELPGRARHNRRPVWSADSKLIALEIEGGHAILSVESAEVISRFNSPYPAAASFSRSSKFVVLCDWSDAKLVKLS